MSDWRMVACSECHSLDFCIRRNERQRELRVECADCGAVFMRQMVAR